MNSVHGYMGFEIQVSAPEISLELAVIIHGLSADALRKRVQYAGSVLQIPCPTARDRRAYFAFLQEHGTRALPYIRDYLDFLRLSQLASRGRTAITKPKLFGRFNPLFTWLFRLAISDMLG
jgi:hypothetical protein